MPERLCLRAVIRGRVQGVFFRMETQKTAQRHGVSGWVRNNPDGSVEGVFEGEKDRVEAVLEWVRQGGPPLGRVDELAVSREKPTEIFSSFSIRY